jgi:hypothetical protein
MPPKDNDHADRGTNAMVPNRVAVSAQRFKVRWGEGWAGERWG